MHHVEVSQGSDGTRQCEWEEDPRREPYPRTDAHIKRSSDGPAAVVHVRLRALINQVARGVPAPNQKRNDFFSRPES